VTTAPDLPTGTVTFLFTDLEGSTRMWEEYPDAMGDALARHDEILREAVADHGGAIVKTTGDGVHAVFRSARAGIDAALDAQRRLQAADWATPVPLLVRMGLNSGEAELRDGDYYGQSVNRAARIMAAAHGGQVAISQTTAQLLEDSLPPGVTLVDLGEHRLRDLARTEHVFQVQHPDLPAEFPPLRSLDAYPSNLPAQRTSFVGRDEDVDAVAAQLRQHRVVTITGVGGVGKSRLAIQVAATILPRFPDGAWLCELASITDERLVADTVADAVGVPAGSGPAREALPWYLRNRKALLVIDNCEHLLGPVIELVDDLLTRCPQVVILATSREPLGVEGEQTYALNTLLPPAGADARAVRASSAGRLFLERAQAARHDFVLDDDNAAAVAEICARLDGIPLAIELAAARVRSLTPAQILDRLDERFRLLTGGTRARGRHQTLRGALAWSADLLEPDERRAFARLSVFVAPFDLVAAESVIGPEAWEHLDTLVDKSLMLAEEVRGEMRYRMLETVREFAAELLLEQGDVADARTRHAHHYAALGYDLSLEGSYRSATVIRREARNMGAALAWLAAEGDVQRSLRLALAFESIYLFRDAGGVGRMLEAALAIPGALEHPHAPRAMAAAANRSISRGESPHAAYTQARASLDLARDLGVDVGIQHHLNVAATYMRSGHLDEARESARAAIALSADDPLQATRSYVVLCALERWRGDLPAARAAADAAEEAARRAEQPFDLAYALLVKGYAYEEVDPEGVLAMYHEAIRIGEERLPGGMPIVCYALANAARVHARLGETDEMVAELDRAVTLTAAHGSREEYGTVLAITGMSLLIVGATVDAAIIFSAATHLFPMENLAMSIGVTLDEMQERLTAAIGIDALTAAWERGSAMSAGEARDHALAALARVRPPIDA
jgi:predicted ATPase/class 3 adenylate cyclase